MFMFVTTLLVIHDTNATLLINTHIFNRTQSSLENLCLSKNINRNMNSHFTYGKNDVIYTMHSKVLRLNAPYCI
jgi:hypothetical protein